MLEFERLALDCYATHAPALATPEKRRFVARLGALGTDESALVASALADPVDELLARPHSREAVATLIGPGPLLQPPRQAIHRAAKDTDRASSESRALAADGHAASVAVVSRAVGTIAERIGTGDGLYPVFVDVSDDVLAELDGLADPVDEIFGERFGLRF